MKNLPIFSIRHSNLTFAAAGISCLLIAVLSICMGAAGLSLSELWQALFDTGSNSPAVRILWYVRLPRTVACLLAGAALAVSGAMLQAILANPLASPSIIGVNAGAGLAVSLCCALGDAVAGWTVAGISFAGAMAAALLVFLVARKTGASRMTVVLGGVAVSTLMNAGTEAIATLFPDVAVGSADFRMGGFSSVSLNRLWPAAILILIGLAAAFTLSNDLDVLSLGEDTARGLGMRVGATRTLLLCVAALLAGATVSFAGILGFVGLIVPHIARRFVGAGSEKLLPMCALCGAALVTLCDLAARLLFSPFELPVGILLSFIGGPFFLALLAKKGGGRHA